MSLIRLCESHINVGEPLPCSVFDGSNSLLLKEGLIVKTHEQLRMMITRGMFAEESFFPAAKSEKEGTIKKVTSPFSYIDKLIPMMEDIFTLSWVINQDDITEPIMTASQLIQQACECDQDAALGWIMCNPDLPVCLKHHIHTAMICAIMAEHLTSMSKKKRLSLIAAALTMNIAILDLEVILMQQKEKITEKQQQEREKHPKQIVELLSSVGVKDKIWLGCLLQHHEMSNGKGYPLGLKGEQFKKIPRILALASIYSERMISRIYKHAVLPNAEIREHFMSRAKYVDTQLPIEFLDVLGVFTLGASVQLLDNESAIVVRQTDIPGCPQVCCLTDKYNKPEPPVLRDTKEGMYMIRGMLVHGQLTVKPDRDVLWSYG